MNHKRLVWFVCLVGFTITTTEGWAEDPVYIPDPLLKTAIEAALGVTDPTPSDMLTLYSFDSTNSREHGIQDLSGLDYATNLQSLQLSYNQIEDLRPLSGLSQLVELELYVNNISDLGPLSSLTLLTKLDVSRNYISDLSALAWLPQLVELDLDYNQISELSALAGLQHLDRLDLDDNQISDLSDLSSLTTITSLWLRLNQITDLSALASLVNLKQLDIKENQVDDIGVLGDLTDLEVIYAGYNQISDISPLTNLGSLNRLDLQANPLNEAACTQHLPQIRLNNPGIRLDYDGCSNVGTFSLDISSTAGGWVSLPGEGLFTYAENTRVTLQAVPLGSYQFVAWTGSAVGAGQVTDPFSANTQLTLDASTTVQAQFTPSGSPTALEVTTEYATQVTATQARLWGYLVHDGTEACRYRFSYWADTAFGQSDWSMDQVTSGEWFYGDVQGLAPNTLYTFQAEVKNEGPILSANGTAQFTTLPIDLPQEPHPIWYVAPTPTLNPLGPAGSQGNPLLSIQTAIEAAGSGSTIMLLPGTYHEGLMIPEKNLTLQGVDTAGHDPVILDTQGQGPVAYFNTGKDVNTVLCNVTLTQGQGAVLSINSAPILRHCLIVGNQGLPGAGGHVIHCINSQVIFDHCTIADNRTDAKGAGMALQNSDVSLLNSIIWQNTPTHLWSDPNSSVVLKYSTIEHARSEWGLVGLGTNIESDPLFVRPGRWLQNTQPLVWTPGDYHLRSQNGHWDSTSQIWLRDTLHSPCIDRGDNQRPVGPEPIPHGQIVNMGCYGSTSQASKSIEWNISGVDIPDPILRDAIESTLGIMNPTGEDMLGLTYLQSDHDVTHGIQDLTGLQYAENLQSLILSYNQITDISVLKDLYNLYEVVLNDNFISDISPVSELPYLIHLDLHRNLISDLSDVASLTKLEYFSVRHNRVSDISPLAGLTELWYLQLHDNQIEDISALTSHTKLETLDLSKNPLNDAAYNGLLDTIAANNPAVSLKYDPKP